MATAKLPDDLTAVLFSGGDAPGMNALLRALVRLGINRHTGRRLLGIRDGYKGLVRAAERVKEGRATIESTTEEILAHEGQYGMLRKDQDLILLDSGVVSGIVVQGGTILRSARCVKFREDAQTRAEAAAFLKNLGVRNLIVCGGNGSLDGAKALSALGGLKVIGVPATIDNDFAGSDMALGVQTAVESVVWAVDHFKDTARSHRRVMVLETMGRHSGELTQYAAIASGAEYSLIREKGVLTMDRVRRIAERIKSDMERGRTHTIVLVAEGLEFEPEENPAAKASTEETAAKPKENPAHHFARWLEKCFGNPPGKNGDVDVDIEVRPSVLGHLQRGGRPAPADAILAARFADAAWEALVDPKISGGVVVLRSNDCTTVSFEEIDRDPKRGNWQKRQALQKALSGW